VTGGSADAGADIEHVHVASQTQPTDGLVDGLVPEVVVLIEVSQLVDLDPSVDPDAERRELIKDALDLLVELHPLDVGARRRGSALNHRSTVGLLDGPLTGVGAQQNALDGLGRE